MLSLKYESCVDSCIHFSLTSNLLYVIELIVKLRLKQYHHPHLLQSCSTVVFSFLKYSWFDRTTHMSSAIISLVDSTLLQYAFIPFGMLLSFFVLCHPINLAVFTASSEKGRWHVFWLFVAILYEELSHLHSISNILHRLFTCPIACLFSTIF